MKWCVLVLVFAGLSRGDNAFNCPKLNSQDEIDLDKIMGKWYVVEILEHKDPLKKPTGTMLEVVNACPVVYLKSSHDMETHPNLKLLWIEEAGNVEYTFRIPEMKRKGFWRVITNQNGTMTQKSNYRQFVGSVHVMKAVASDMVLTFCSRSSGTVYDAQLYSLLLSRQHTLQKSDKRGVHNLLSRRGLKLVSIRETCVNGEAGSKRCALDLVSWTTVIGLLSSSLLVRSWQ